MGILYTTKWKIPFLVDDEDEEPMSYFTWFIGAGYPSTNVRNYYHNVLMRGRVLRCQTFLLGKAPEGLVWDHENRCKLDCRRQNIHAVTESMNAKNSGLRTTNKSGFKGIHHHVTLYSDLWQARITVGGERFNLGYFKTKEEAIYALLEAEKKFGIKENHEHSFNLEGE